MLRNRGRARLADFEIGDRINVYGFRDGGTGFVDALIVRNLDKPVVKQFIQLNNVEVASLPSASGPPATFIVQNKVISPCWDFGAGQETRSSSVIPCPLGIAEKSPITSSETSPAYYPRKYVIEVNSKTQVHDLNRKSLALDKIQIGDSLNIYGSYTGDSSQILALTVRDLSQSINNRGTLQITVSDSNTYCIMQGREGVAKPLIYPAPPCGIIYDATVEVYDERGFVGKKTTARGTAVFENLQFGTYTVVASAPGYERAKEAAVLGLEKPGPVVSIAMMLQKIVPPSSNRPPQINGLPAIPVNIEPGQQVSFSWSATDPDGDNLSWSGSIEKGGGIGEAFAGVCPSSSPNTTFTTSQTWSSPGVYRVSVTVSDCKGGSDTNEFKVQVGGGSGNLPPVISGVKGPTALKVGEIGTWSVSAYDPENGSLSYSVIWGDETPVTGGGGGIGAPLPLRAEISQTATFTHSYAKAGVYTPIFTVTDNGNLSAKTSMSVNVGGVASIPSITVTSPNGGETWQAGKDYEIRWTSQNIQWPYITVALLKSGSVIGQPLFTHLANDGVERWTIPSNLAPGSDYKISIYCTPISGVAGCEAKDQSDAPFSIVSSFVGQPNYDAGPAGPLIRGQSYDFVGKVTSAFPNAKVYFFLQRPDGTLKYSEQSDQDILQKAPSHFTDASGNYSVSARQTLTIEGKNGTWISWVTVGGVASNKRYHDVKSDLSSITVLSPNGGEKFTYGQSLNGKWRVDFTTNKSGSFTTFLIDESRGFRLQLGKSTHAFISSSGLTYDVSPYSLTSSIPSGGNYKFLVIYASDDGLDKTEDLSDAPFSIAASAGLGAANSQQLANVLEAMLDTLNRLSEEVKKLR